MKREEPLDIDAVVRLAQNGDRDAFAQIYEHFLTPIYRYVYYKVPQGEVEDLVENVFLKTWQSLDKYKLGSVPFGAWIFRIAHNVTVDFYRTHKEFVELEEHVEDTKDYVNPHLQTEQDWMREDLQAALSKLPKGQREVIILRFLNDRSYAEIASFLGKNEGAVRAIQVRALQNLKKSLRKT